MQKSASINSSCLMRLQNWLQGTSDGNIGLDLLHMTTDAVGSRRQGSVPRNKSLVGNVQKQCQGGLHDVFLLYEYMIIPTSIVVKRCHLVRGLLPPHGHVQYLPNCYHVESKGSKTFRGLIIIIVT